jgi:glucose-1-phosphate adenylyltransferase
MGIYIFSWKALKEALLTLSEQSNCDFGKHVIPYCHEKGETLVAYEYNGYWKDVGTLGSYWEANMELIDIVPEFNLYEEYWKIYTKNDILPPQFIAAQSVTERCLIGDGSEIYGEVYNSVIGPGVVIEEGAVVRDSIIMQNAVIRAGAIVSKSIIAENAVIGENSELGVGEEVPNKVKPSVYSYGLVVVGENSVIPANVKIGKNTAVTGVTVPEDYPGGLLESGEILDKAGDVA